MDFIFLAYFQQNDKILCQIFPFFTGFENFVSTIELDQSLLACRDIPDIKPDILNDLTALVSTLYGTFHFQEFSCVASNN